MRTSNPALRTSSFTHARGFALDETNRMTVQGAATKSLLLLAIAIGAAAYVWSRFFAYGDQLELGARAVMPWLYGGMIGGLILALVIVFKPVWAPVLAPLYAVLEGFFLGGISAVFEATYTGIVMPAVGLTLGTLLTMLIAYKTRLIRVTDKFRMGVVAATGGICVLYFVGFLLQLFGISMPMVHSAGPLGIGFSVFVVVVAAMNLVLDFDLIEQGARRGAPKSMEWYGAFALLVTLVWLYLEILRLLSKLRSRR